MAHSVKQTITISIETLDKILRALDGDENLLRDLTEEREVVGSPMHMLIEKFHQQQAWLSVNQSTSELTAEQFRRLYHYDPDTGVITKRVRSNADHGENIPIGSLSKGYIRILIGKRLHFAHRLAFLYMTGEWPSQVIDHINGNRSDNRFCNLRDVDQGTNALNKDFDHVQNKHGFAGVRLETNGKKFKASIRFRRETIQLGNYDTPEEAHLAYVKAQSKARKGERPEGIQTIKGYSRDKTTGKYQVTVRRNKKPFYVGQYESEEEASAAYVEAKQRLQVEQDPNFRKVKGYTYSKSKGTFPAVIQRDRKAVWLGEFGTEAEARDAYLTAKQKLDQGMSISELPVGKNGGVKGYSFNKKAGKYLASIRRDNKSVYLGLFETAEEAAEAYRIAKAELSI